MELITALNNINFVVRYMEICDKHNNLKDSMRGNHKELYDEVLAKLGYKAKYFNREHFYRITSKFSDYEIGLQLILKDGLVEPMMDVKKGDGYIGPDGRFDFIPEKMGIEFDRKKYNLPKYTSEQELEEILRGIFSIYEDLKGEILKSEAIG